jgi:hypothetical protein
MKPRNREVNIFNMSVLDLLTGALGAVCFLTLALFPSYYKTHKTSPGTSSNTDHAQPAKAGAAPRSLEGPVPPFGFLNIQAVAKDRPGLCASLEVTGASSASGGDLSSFRRQDRTGDSFCLPFVRSITSNGSRHADS